MHTPNQQHDPAVTCASIANTDAPSQAAVIAASDQQLLALPLSLRKLSLNHAGRLPVLDLRPLTNLTELYASGVPVGSLLPAQLQCLELYPFSSHHFCIIKPQLQMVAPLKQLTAFSITVGLQEPLVAGPSPLLSLTQLHKLLCWFYRLLITARHVISLLMLLWYHHAAVMHA